MSNPRQAKCMCGATVLSNPELPFFEDRGRGTPAANTICKNCGFSDTAHDNEARLNHLNFVCSTFQPHGPWEVDIYYCGCRGWD